MPEPNAGNKVDIEKVPFTCYFGASVIGNELRACALEQMSGADREKLMLLNDLDSLEVSLAGANAVTACEAEKSCFVVDKKNLRGAAVVAVFDDIMKGSFKVVGPLDDSRVRMMQEWADQHCRVTTSRSVAGNTIKNEESVSCSSELVGEGGGTFTVQKKSHATSRYGTGGMAGSHEAFDKIAKSIRERHERATSELGRNFDRTAAEIQRRHDQAAAEGQKGFDETAREIARRFDETAKENDRKFDETVREINRRFDETAKEIDRRFDGTARATDTNETPEETLARLSGDMASALAAAGETEKSALGLVSSELADHSDTTAKLEALGKMAETASISGYGDKLAELKKLPRFSRNAKVLDVEIKIAMAKIKGSKSSPFARRITAINSLYEKYIGK